jgi:glycosyltransferase involved in cell wall biosynthesis
MRQLPNISVIIPVYNGQNYLRQAVESVFAQTYNNYELIVVDDGSNDGTWDIIQSYGFRLKGVRKENGGVASALNCGIQHASGDYIAWLSHDDLFLPDKLERQVAFLNQSPQFKACYTDYYIIDENGKVIQEIKTLWFPRQEALRVLFGIAYINGSTMMIERGCFEKVGLFSEHLKYTQDTEMWLRLLRHFEIGRVPEKLGKWRNHPSQGSRRTKIHRAEAQTMYCRIFRELGILALFPEWKDSANDPKTIAKAYTWLGNTLSSYGRWYRVADRQYAHAMAVYPSLRNPAIWMRFQNLVLSILRPCYSQIWSFVRPRLRSAKHWFEETFPWRNKSGTVRHER